MKPFAGWLLAGAAAVAGLVGLSLWNPASGSAPPFCLVRLLFDLPCPGCGMTRALHALAHGNLGEAIHFHPLAPVLVAEAALGWAIWGARLRRQARPAVALGVTALGAKALAGDSRAAHAPGWSSPAPAWWALLYGHGAVFFAVWVGRLATGSLPW